MKVEIDSADGTGFIFWTNTYTVCIEMRGGFLYLDEETFPTAQVLSTDIVTVTPDPKR